MGLQVWEKEKFHFEVHHLKNSCCFSRVRRREPMGLVIVSQVSLLTTKMANLERDETETETACN